MKLTRTTAIAAAMLAIAVGAGAADEDDEGEIMDVPNNVLGKYAAFSKLEANLAEVAAGTLLGFVMQDGMEGAMDADDPADDIAAAEAYVARLGEMNLSDAERDALEAFEARWTDLMAARETLIADGPTGETLSAYWTEVNAIDEIMDDALKATLAQEPGTN